MCIRDRVHRITLTTRCCYGLAIYADPDATLGDLREAVNTLEEIERIARRVFGGAHPDVANIEKALQDARDVLRARETPGNA